MPTALSGTIRPRPCSSRTSCATAEAWDVSRALLAPADDELWGDEIRIKDDGEIEPVKMAQDPGQPTAKQVEEHRLTHSLYRSWCKWCVMGRGRGQQHRPGATSSIAIIGLDYFFITAGGVKKKDELDYSSDAATEDARKKGDIVKCIVFRCHKSKVVLMGRTMWRASSLETFSGSGTARSSSRRTLSPPSRPSSSESLTSRRSSSRTSRS